MKVLLDKGVKTVIITSVELEQDELLLLAANRDSGETVRLQYPKIPGSFTGSGDVFTAVLMGWLGNGHTLKIACEKAVSTLQAVLNRTLQHALELSNGGTPSAEQIELQLIQCKREIEEPPEFITSNSH
jgi:pyridoxine kinase